MCNSIPLHLQSIDRKLFSSFPSRKNERKEVYFKIFMSINFQLMLTSKCDIWGFHSHVFDGGDLLGLVNICRRFVGNYCPQI